MEIHLLSLSVVDYHYRSLERRLDVPLLLDQTMTSMEDDSSEPGVDKQTVVNENLEEWLDLEYIYWYHYYHTIPHTLKMRFVHTPTTNITSGASVRSRSCRDGRRRDESTDSPTGLLIRYHYRRYHTTAGTYYGTYHTILI